ncbi:MAG: hypothetical protein AAF679_03335 [Pseudomonadota bacterium]
MELSHSEPLDLPAAQAFAYASEVTRSQALARRRGSVLERLETGPLVEGEVWRLHRNGKLLAIALADHQAPTGLGFEAEFKGVEVTLGLAIEPRGLDRSTLTVDLEAVARSLAGRLVLAPVILAQTNAQARFEKMVKKLARKWEQDYLQALGE